jgi:hypothetical protein
MFTLKYKNISFFFIDVVKVYILLDCVQYFLKDLSGNCILLDNDLLVLIYLATL